MKKQILTLLGSLAIAASAFAHGDIELGPNGGRILEFSKDETMHGEVTAKDGKFHVALLDKAMKPVALEKQELTATSGDKAKPEKLAVEKADGHFTVPQLKGGDYWVIFQFKPAPDAKLITARLHYDETICSKCKAQEWLCECMKNEGKKK